MVDVPANTAPYFCNDVTVIGCLLYRPIFDRSRELQQRFHIVHKTADRNGSFEAKIQINTRGI